MASLCQAQLTGPLPGYTADMDFFCYYGGFGVTEVLQAQYFDMFILEPSQISSQQVADIRNGFDDISGTEDDVLVFAYISMGETYLHNETGDGSGPVYFNGSDTIYQNAGYASYFLDDFDENAEPDMNDTWSSYYVNAGDPTWWAFNEARLDESLYDKQCDGLFMDTMGVPFPTSWGGSYEWTTQGMAEYVAYLRANYPDKYLFGNNPSIYMHPALPGYPFRDLVRNAMNAYMYESYYLTWDWDLEIGYVSPWFESARDTWAPLINAEAAKDDGYTPVALDYGTVDQENYETLLAQQIQYTEVDLGWLTAISSVWLNEIRYDTYHNHPVDNNSPTWNGLPGILYFERSASSITLYWNAAQDQTMPISYSLYFDNVEPDFSNSSAFQSVVPSESEFFDWEYTMVNTSLEGDYFAVLRAADATSENYLDQNRRVVHISNQNTDIVMDGLFNDWVNIDNIDTQESIDDTPNPACDFEDIWVSSDTESLYFSCSFRQQPDLSQYYYHLFLNTDDSDVTGFHSGDAACGAEYMVENLSLFRYTGIDNSWNWEWVSSVVLYEGALENQRFEASIALADLNLSQSELSMIFNVNDNDIVGLDDYAPNNYSQASYSYALSPVSIDHSVFPTNMVVSVFPNPFNNSVTFTVDGLSEFSETAKIQIFDLKGRLVNEWPLESVQNSQMTWNGIDVNHKSIDSGVYIYRLTNSNPREGQTFSAGKILALK
jgi:hypothetical protein